MKYLISILLIGFLFACNNINDGSEDSFDKEFEKNFNKELIEVQKMELSGEWKNIEPSGDELQCPCCDYFTLRERGGYDICPICFWEDDGIDVDKLDKYSGPNHITLRQGRNNFLKFGACDSSMIKNVLNESERRKFRLEKRSLK